MKSFFFFKYILMCVKTNKQTKILNVFKKENHLDIESMFRTKDAFRIDCNENLKKRVVKKNIFFYILVGI